MLLSITAAILVNTHSVAAHTANPVSLSGGCAEWDGESERETVVIVAPPLSCLQHLSPLVLLSKPGKQPKFYAKDFLLIHSGTQKGTLFIKKKKKNPHKKKSILLSTAVAAVFLSLLFIPLFPRPPSFQGLLVGGCFHSYLICILLCIWTLGWGRPSLLLLLS